MLPFNEYKKLPEETQKHSIIMWVDELLDLTNLENVNQLTEYLAYNFPERCGQKRQSKYLNKKRHGQPIREDSYALFLDEKLSGGANVLFSPLWALLEYDELTTADAVKFASYLPFDLQRQILSNDRRKIKGNERVIYKLAKIGSFDALTAMTIVYLHIKSKLNELSKLVVNKE